MRFAHWRFRRWGGGYDLGVEPLSRVGEGGKRQVIPLPLLLLWKTPLFDVFTYSYIFGESATIQFILSSVKGGGKKGCLVAKLQKCKDW